MLKPAAAMFFGWLLLVQLSGWGWQPGDGMPTFTYHERSVAPAGRNLQLVAIANEQLLLGQDSGNGAFAYRLNDTQAEPITCPPDQFMRYEHAALGGPLAQDMNEAGWFVGYDEDVNTNLHCIVQAPSPDNTCYSFTVEDSAGTICTGITNRSDALGTFLTGWFWRPVDNVQGEKGVERFHGFIKTPTETIILDGDHTRNILRDWNTAGTVIGESWRNINPLTGSFITVPFVRTSNGTITDVVAPDGAPICLNKINDSGIVVASRGACNGNIGGVGWWYDSNNDTISSFEMPPPFTPGCKVTSLLPTGITSHALITGTLIEECPTNDPPPYNITKIAHGFVAVPVIPDPTPVAPAPAHKPEQRKRKSEHPPVWQPRKHLTHWWKLNNNLTGGWFPALDENDRVVLSDGNHVIGREKEK